MSWCGGKEINETRFWLRLVAHREWIKEQRLDPLLQESLELKKIFGSMMARVKVRRDKQRSGEH